MVNVKRLLLMIWVGVLWGMLAGIFYCVVETNEWLGLPLGAAGAMCTFLWLREK